MRGLSQVHSYHLEQNKKQDVYLAKLANAFSYILHSLKIHNFCNETISSLIRWNEKLMESVTAGGATYFQFLQPIIFYDDEAEQT